MDSFIRALKIAEAEAGFTPTRADNSVNRKRLARLFSLVGDIGDDAIWTTRVANAVATRKAKGNGDCAWIWMGDDERAAMRIDQLASGPVWSVAKEAADEWDGDAWVAQKNAEIEAERAAKKSGAK